MGNYSNHYYMDNQPHSQGLSSKKRDSIDTYV